MACVLVTGASGGIGGAIAATFAKAGHSVVLGCHKNPATADALCQSLKAQGHTAMVLCADVRSEAGVDAMFNAAEEAFGPVEILINNAGFAQQKQFQDITTAEWDDMMAVHVRGAFLCSRRALPAMLRAKRGSMLNIASVWGQVGASCEVHYSAAKAALIGMTRALSQEVAPSGVRVNCLTPGAVETAMLDGFSHAEKAALAAEVPLGRLGTPQDVANAALFMATAEYITGEVLTVDGGWA